MMMGVSSRMLSLYNLALRGLQMQSDCSCSLENKAAAGTSRVTGLVLECEVFIVFSKAVGKVLVEGMFLTRIWIVCSSSIILVCFYMFIVLCSYE